MLFFPDVLPVVSTSPGESQFLLVKYGLSEMKLYPLVASSAFSASRATLKYPFSASSIAGVKEYAPLWQLAHAGLVISVITPPGSFLTGRNICLSAADI